MTNATICFVVGEQETTYAVTSLHTKAFEKSGSFKKQYDSPLQTPRKLKY